LKDNNLPAADGDTTAKKVNIYIPIKNREVATRRCVKFILKNSGDLIDKIIVIDYGSQRPIKKIKGAIVERIEAKTWNKAHAINLAIKKYPNEYIITLDCDMLLSKAHFSKIKKHLSPQAFIIDTNVRRILPKDVVENYSEMIIESYPWREQDVGQMFNTANGGIQVYSKMFYDAINGIQESLGLYHGSVDNIMYYRARMAGLDVIDLSYPLLHVEHSKKKEQNYEPSERKIAEEYRGFKASYLNHVVKESLYVNPEKIAQPQPQINLFSEFTYLLGNREKIINQAISEGKKEVRLGYQTFKLDYQPSVMLAVIDNTGYLPDYFVWDLFQIWQTARASGIDLDICPINACDVNSMRNVAVKMSLGQLGSKKYNYIIQCDSDHRYPADFVNRFLALAEENKWPIVTGLTSGKKHPYNHTQYYKINEEINAESNSVKCTKPTKKIIDVEASGPVGMLISTKVFEKMQWPYYHMDFSPRIVKEKKNDNGKLIEVDRKVDAQIGGDLVFCKKLKELNIPIKLDLETVFPHAKQVFVGYNKVLDETYTA
jgi:hypothetical protein